MFFEHPRSRLWLLPCLVAVVAACRGEAVDASPERVVEELIERMARVHGDPKQARLAYELLWTEGKKNLAERAKRASAVAGKKVAPEEMLAPSHFSLAYEPTSYRAVIQGDWALVTVTGSVPSSQQHVVKCVREGGAWRVVLELPALASIRRRPDAGP